MDYSLVNDQEQLVQLQRATQPIPDHDDTSEDEFDLGDNEQEAETVFAGKSYAQQSQQFSAFPS